MDHRRPDASCRPRSPPPPTDDPDVEITVTWTTADGATGSFPLSRFEDSGEYQYHVALPQPLPAQPVTVTATSSLGGTSRAITPTAWPGATPPPLPAGYQKDFIDAYMTPTDIKARIKRLARQYPDLVDVHRPAEQDAGLPAHRGRLPRRPGRAPRSWSSR